MPNFAELLQQVVHTPGCIFRALFCSVPYMAWSRAIQKP